MEWWNRMKDGERWDSAEKENIGSDISQKAVFTKAKHQREAYTIDKYDNTQLFKSYYYNNYTKLLSECVSNG